MYYLQNIILIMLLLTLNMDTILSGRCRVTSTSDYYKTGNCACEVECSFAAEDVSDQLSGWSYCGERQRQRNYYNKGYGDQYKFTHNFTIALTLTNVDSSINPFSDIAKLVDRIKTVTIINSESIPSQLHNLAHVSGANLVYNKIEIINLNAFLSLAKLNYINASHNTISSFDTRLENADATVRSRKITTIDLSYNFIKYLPNNCFLYFMQLEHLNLSHNSISNIEILTFEGISNLQTLQLAHNNLLNIGHTLTRFVNLKELSLDSNLLTSIVEINFNTMTNLQKLNLSLNKLKDIEDKSFQNLISLIKIDLSHNQIYVIQKNFFKNNPKLYSLDLSNNNIKRIESESFKYNNISKFNIENNKISGLLEDRTFWGMHLDSLDLSGYKITALGTEVFKESSISFLNLSSNEISNISKSAFKYLDSLQELDISNNTIENITKQTFKNLTSLTKLNLSHNAISVVEPQTFRELRNLKILLLGSNSFMTSTDRHTFEGLTALTRIELTYTRISSMQDEVFSEMKLLKHLNFSHSELTNISYNVFKTTDSIEIIDISNNLLRDFKVNTTSISTLKELYLNNNKITNVENSTFFGLAYLQVLNLASNKIIVIESEAFRTLESLNRLDLSSNVDLEIGGNIFDKLTTLTVVALKENKSPFNFKYATNTSIKQLDLSTCNIENLNHIFIFRVINLTNLDLSRNKIENIDKLSFQEMSSLVWLDLSFNLISFIQPGAFRKTQNIKSLNLHDNDIVGLQFGVLDGLEYLETLNMSNNALKSFDANLLHNIPRISTINLDNNVIEYFVFEDFSDKSLHEVSIGGNSIPCSVFADLKRNKFSAFYVTAERLDYHSENVDGITCRSKLNKNLPFQLINNTEISSTYSFNTLGSAIENLRVTIEKINSNSMESDKGNILENLNHALQSIVVTNQRSQNITNLNLDRLTYIMKQLINVTLKMNSLLILNEDFNKNLTFLEINTKNLYNNNETMQNQTQLESYVKVLNEEKDKMITELKLLYQDLIQEKTNENLNKSNIRNMNNDVVVLLYIIVICLLMKTAIFVYNPVYRFFKKRSRRDIELHNSTQTIENVIEMHG